MLRSSRSKKSNRNGTASSRRESLVRLKKTSQEFVRRVDAVWFGTSWVGWPRHALYGTVLHKSGDQDRHLSMPRKLGLTYNLPNDVRGLRRRFQLSEQKCDRIPRQ